MCCIRAINAPLSVMRTLVIIAVYFSYCLMTYTVRSYDNTSRVSWFAYVTWPRFSVYRQSACCSPNLARLPDTWSYVKYVPALKSLVLGDLYIQICDSTNFLAPCDGMSSTYSKNEHLYIPNLWLQYDRDEWQGCPNKYIQVASISCMCSLGFSDCPRVTHS